VAGAAEDAVHRVIVAVGNRVELMVVAPGATHAESQKCFPNIVDRVVDRQIVFVILRAEPPRSRDISSGNDMLVAICFSLCVEQVSRELFTDELVIWLVLIKGLDYIVSIFVSSRNWKVRVIAACIRIADDVEPVPAPSFAVLRGGEQPVDDLFECAGRG